MQTLQQRAVKSFVLRFLYLLLGFWGIALGLNFQRLGHTGFGPWEVLHEGLSFVTPLTFGQASIVVGVVVVIISLFFKTKVTFATVCNMFLIGIFTDIIYDAVPFFRQELDSTALRYVYWSIGTLLNGLFIGVYINAKLGAGPRDGFCLSLSRITGLRVRTIRTCMEAFALISGWILGGTVGISTLVYCLVIGPIMEWALDHTKFPGEVIDMKYMLKKYEADFVESK